MNEDDKDRQTRADDVRRDIAEHYLRLFSPGLREATAGHRFPFLRLSYIPPSPAVKRAANAGSGKGVCQRRRRRGGGGGLLCEAASSTPVVRLSVRRSPVVLPCPKPIRSSAPSAATTTTRWPTKSVFLRMLCMRDYSEFKRRAEMR